MSAEMTSITRRRRLLHGDVDGRKDDQYDATGMDLDGLNEPLLGKRELNIRDTYPAGRNLEDILDEEKKKQQVHWTSIFSRLISQWAQWIANIVFGSTSLIGRYMPFPSFDQHGTSKRLPPPPLTPLQEERLRNLQQRLKVPFDGSRPEHQDALRQLWRLAYPNRELPPLKSELWKEMGWQGTDPSTDFRSGGYISLENLIYFAIKYPESFQRLLNKQDGRRAEWEYPFAVAGVNISFMLAQMLDLQSGNASSSAGSRFMELLEEDEMAFDDLYCVTFQMMDAQWLAKRASYMDFNDVVKSTRTQLERELLREGISSVRDLPAYTLLKR